MKQAQVFSTSYELPEKIWVGFGTYRITKDGGNVELRYLSKLGFPVSDDIVKVYSDAPFIDASPNEPVIVFFRKGKSGAKALVVTSLKREPAICSALLEAATASQNLFSLIEKHSEQVFEEVDRILQTYLTDPRFVRKDGKLILSTYDGFITVKVKKNSAKDLSKRYPSRFIYFDDETLGIRGLK